MPDKSPDVCQIEFKNAKKKNFPSKYDYRIFINEKAYEEIFKHAAANTKIEIGGVLLGNVCKDHAGFFLEITNIITAQKTENTMSNITFTHETWAEILNIKDGKYPDKMIVGWYHSHPDFDIFLSTQDLHIHENFFNQSHQVAFVIDPINNKEGFFIWREGETKLIDEYWIGKDRKIKIESPKSPIEEEEEKVISEKENGYWFEKYLKYGLITIYIIAFILLAILNFNSNYNLSQAEEKIKKYEQIYGTIKSEDGERQKDTKTDPKSNEGSRSTT